MDDNDHYEVWRFLEEKLGEINERLVRIEEALWGYKMSEGHRFSEGGLEARVSDLESDGR